MADPFGNYLKALRQALRAGNATEHTHRPALKALIESLHPKVVATNEPTHVECGAPDFAVSHRTPAGPLTIGHVETKDVGRSLDEVERSEQLRRYRGYLSNLVLTDYLEFRWYVDGELRRTARVGRLGGDGSVVRDKAGCQATLDLLKDFLAHAPEPITKPRELAERMARLTPIMRDIIITAFENGKASATLRDLRAAFAKTLIPDLDQPDKTAQFADMFAQTIAYGLFAARCNHGSSGPFRRLGAAAEIPKTNPFLRKLFTTITGPDLDDEPYCGFVDDLAALLNNANIEEILAEFGKRTRREDPVVHFYETFLATYDPQVRERRGVYYTPEPVVSYIVRSVDHILRTRFGLPGGLADTATVTYTHEVEAEDGSTTEVTETAPRVLILDPACGTGTFLYAVVDHIREQFMARGDAGMWSGYVRDHLLPRLFGFELLMAPYAVAHLKLGMQLAAQDLPPEQRATWAYDFAGDERLGVYLTNTLEEAERHAEDLFGPLRVITEEANAAARIKRDMPIMVIIGNPPYSNFGMMNKGEWISELIAEWRPQGERKWNPDDFMKFMRWAQWRIERTGAGVLGFITNHAYIDGLTHRAMRLSLMQTFTEIYVLDLHGSVRRGDTAREHVRDQNVFDIQQGVAIGLFIKEPGRRGPATVYHAELWGPREEKYATLLASDLESTAWTPLHEVQRETCLGEQCFFAPIAMATVDEYCLGWSVKDVFRATQNGIKTDRDALFVDMDRDVLLARMRQFYSHDALDPTFRDLYRVKDSSSYDLMSRREHTRFDPENARLCLYRPFDHRWLYYGVGMTSRPAWRVMRHMLAGNNLALLACRQQAKTGFHHVLCSRGISECCAVSLRTKEITSVFPLYVYPASAGSGAVQRELTPTSEWTPGPGGRLPNLGADFVQRLGDALSLSFRSDGVGDLTETFGPEDVFHYIYAVFHSPTYRERYAEFLKIDFPRVPLTSDLGLFRALCALGADLVALHLLEDDYPHASWTRGGEPCPLANLITHYPVPGDNVVAKGHPKYVAPGERPPGQKEPIQQGRVYINKDDRKTGTRGQYFEGVPPEVWGFHIGGYQVCEKWLKDRRGRQLSFEDLTHYQRVVVALKETIRLMSEVDAAIEAHGGWPIQ